MPVANLKVGNLSVTHAWPAKTLYELPLLLVHGLWGGKWQFKDWLLTATNRGFQAFAFDLKGHGESPCRDIGSVSMWDYAADVSLLIEYVGCCVLIGHSMGGLLVQMVASEEPKVKKAVLVASAAPAGIVPSWGILRRMPKYLGALKRHEPFLPSRKDMRQLLFNRLQDDSVYLQMQHDSGRAGAEMAFWRIRPKRMTCPTLVVGCSDDRITPTWQQRRIVARNPGSTYIELEGRGHMPMLEEGAEEAFTRILTWVSS
jgi:pimeloyl-ACP methyl ester carboxylesterase